jgi:CRISPR-associated protein Csm5
MSRLHTRIEVTVELLSPLHVGTGTELLLNYDLVSHEGRTFRVDEEALLEQALVTAEASGAAAMNQLLAGRPAAELLSEADFDPYSPLFRYVMPGTPFTRTAGAKVHEQIKDVYDRPYLPGSSLKGALRTIFAWGLYTAQKRKPDLARLKPGRSWASQPLERELFGRNPNYDWLRALHVEDSQPLATEGHPLKGAGQALALRTVRVYPTETRDSPGLNVDVESVERGAVFHTAFTVDEYGFKDETAGKLGWQGKRRWINRLPALAREHARQRLLAEAEYFKAGDRPAGARHFCDRLINAWSELAPNEFIVQIGWGAGWESKTLGSGLLRADDQAFERLLDRYRMTKEQNRRPGDPFPKSRHLALDHHGHPSEPLGWVKVRLEKAR